MQTGRSALKFQKPSASFLRVGKYVICRNGSVDIETVPKPMGDEVKVRGKEQQNGTFKKVISERSGHMWWKL
jgi:hypothetical protein